MKLSYLLSEGPDQDLLSRVELRFDDDPRFAFGRKKKYVQVKAYLDGEEVGQANFLVGRKYLYARRDREGVYVVPELRRKGLASFMYDQAEMHWNRTVVHAPRKHQTPEGQAFAKGRKMGESGVVGHWEVMGGHPGSMGPKKKRNGQYSPFVDADEPDRWQKKMNR